MGTELAWIESDAIYPVADKTRILSDRKASIGPSLCGKKKISSPPVPCMEIIIDRLSGLFGDFEPYRPTGLLLADRCTLNRVSVRSNVLYF